MTKRSLFSALAVASLLALAMAQADARPGIGGSSGSRGTRTYSAPAPTQTAPGAAQPMQRTITRPGMEMGAPAARQNSGLFGGAFGRGFLGGLLGAGLFGMLFGHGLFGGLDGLTSLIGLLLQVALAVLVARFAWNWFTNRRQPQTVGAMSQRSAPSAGEFVGGSGSSTRPGGGALQIQPQDFQAFEQRLYDIQIAYSDENIGALRSLTTPEMASYFEGDLSANASKGLANKIGAVKLLQGDLSESWRESNYEYATVAMRFSLTDAMVDRATGKVVQGSREQPEQVVELWTFVRPTGGRPQDWRLSAIQQSA